MEVKESAAEALARKNSRRRKYGAKTPLFVFLGALAAVVLIIGIVVAVQIVQSNRIDRAKTIIAQLDINNNFKKPEFPENGDWDGDGVPNGAEDRGGTNVQNEDTDGDGVSDGDEKTLGTNPLEEDTDGDTLADGYELIAGTDPRKTSTDGKTNDAERVLTVTQTKGELTLTLTGNANIADTTIEELDLFGISSNSSIVSGAYDIYSDYDFDTAKATFKIDQAKLEKIGAQLSDLTVLRFDHTTLKYTKVESSVNTSDGTVSAELFQLGTYVAGVERTANDEAVTRIAFLVDNSGSMYPKELCPPSTENDVNFKRLDFAQSLIDRIDGEYSILISKFTADYTLLQGFTDDRKQLENALDSIRNDTEIFTGTHIQSCLEKCMNEFSDGGGGKYRNIIVMLTDGESDENDPKSIEQLSAIAEEKGIVVLTVGLGRDIDRRWLQEFAYSTGGKYYSASDADALGNVYKQIVTTLNYDIVDYDENAEGVKGFALYDTGFDPGDNGFRFKNFRIANGSGIDFGMAVMARDWYLGNLAMSLGDLDPADESTQKYHAPGYDLSGTLYADKYSKHDKLSSLVPDAMTGNCADVKLYLDYKSKGDTLKISEDAEAEYKSGGWVKDTYTIDSGNLDWTFVELLSFDIAGSMELIEQKYGEEEAQLYKALYRLNALRWDDSAYEFDLTGGDAGFERLKKLLSQGVPVVTTIDDSRTVNAVGLIQDTECHRKYVLQVYDSNYPGKIKEVYIEKSPLGNFEINGDSVKSAGTQFTYNVTYEGKQVGISFSDVKAH